MAFSKDKEFKYSIRGIDRVIEERGNQYIKFSQIAWAGSDEEVDPSKVKYDIRKYCTDSEGKEKMLKGVSFFTNDGPTELANILVEEGFGNTEKILGSLMKRDNFKSAVSNIVNGKESSDEETFDLRDIL